jgi:phosphoglycerate kinase
MRKRTVRDIDVGSKRVLVRVDFNVPVEDGRILDDLRIRAALPTIEYLRGRNATVILCSHFGRPKGRRDDRYSLRAVAVRLGELLGLPVELAEDCVGAPAQQAVERMAAGDVLLLENVRFHPEEEENDPAFAKALASLAAVYVNDAFGAAHRAHASTEGVTHHLPAVAGLLMEKEIDYLSRVVVTPAKPLGAIIGGAKISDKMAVLQNLLSKVNVLVIGGGMANTFLKALGRSVGDSLVEDDQLDTARAVVDQASAGDVRLLLPVDVVIADRFAADAEAHTVEVDEVPDGWRILDAGQRSVEAYAAALRACKTIVWNGPLGVIEFPRFAAGSAALARALSDLDATTVIGGGETAALIQDSGLSDRFDHISTGGGAFLEFLEGRELPGVAALLDA